jgi:4,5-DOPA dioxygenase extradiol
VTNVMPAIFFGHGNPTNALLHNAYTEVWATIGRSIMRPKAVLCISAHWVLTWNRGDSLAPRTIYDFGVFRTNFTRFSIQLPEVRNLPRV